MKTTLKTIFTTIILLSGLTYQSKAQSTWNYSITIVNPSATLTLGSSTCGQYQIRNKQYNCSDGFVGNTTSAALDWSVAPGSSYTITGTIAGDGYTCGGSSANLVLMLGGVETTVLDTTTSYTGTIMSTHSVTIDPTTCVLSTPPATTNVTLCCQNNSQQPASATATVNGTIVAGATIMPGATWCNTQTIPMDGSQSFTVQCSQSDPTINNPFGTNDIGQTFNPTNGYNPFQSGSSNNIPGNGGSTTPGSTGGGDYTNTIVISNTNFSVLIYTNNINYPTAQTTGGALDSTLRTVGGQLHADNQTLLAGLGVINNGINGISGQMTIYGAMTTNLLGQVLTAIYTQTNNDQSPQLVGYLTNNANANTATLKNQMIADTAAITNALSGLTNITTTSSDAPVLTNIDNTMAGISNIWAKLDDTTNGDFSTETTQKGITNQLGIANDTLSQINSNTAAILGALTNTNSGSAMDMSQLTNFTWIQANATAATAASATTASGMASDAGALDNGVPAGTAPVFDIEIPLPSGTIDWSINLENDTWSSLWESMRRISTLVIVLGYAYTVIKTLYDHMKLWATTQGGGVPNLQLETLGTGGNVPGVTVFVVIVAFFLIIMAASFLSMFSVLTGAIDWHSMFGTTTSQSTFALVDGKAMHLLNACFPLSFLVSTVISLIVWRLLVWVISLGVVATMRSLPTK